MAESQCVWRDEEGKGQNGPGCGGTTEGRREMPRWMAGLGAGTLGSVTFCRSFYQSALQPPAHMYRTGQYFYCCLQSALRCAALHGTAMHRTVRAVRACMSMADGSPSPSPSPSPTTPDRRPFFPLVLTEVARMSEGSPA